MSLVPSVIVYAKRRSCPVQVGFLLAASVLNTVQITAFFLKFILYLGPEDQWNKWRILGWMLLGAYSH